MAVSKGDIYWIKAQYESDVPSSNGGLPNCDAFIPVHQRYALLPRVTRGERVAGIERWRKFFVWNASYDASGGDTAIDVHIYGLYPSPCDDRIFLAFPKGDSDFDALQSSFTFDPFQIRSTAAGQLAADVPATSSSLTVNFDVQTAFELYWEPGQMVAVHGHFMSGQTLAPGLKVGDSVSYDSTSSLWVGVATPSDVNQIDVYPYGTVAAKSSPTVGTVFTYHSSGAADFVRLIDSTTNSSFSVTTSGVTSVSATIHPYAGSLTVVYTIGGTSYTASDTPSWLSGTGEINGPHISSGTVSYWSDGVLSITFDTALDNPSTVQFTAKVNPVRVAPSSSTSATLLLMDPLSQSFSSTSTFVSFALSLGDLRAQITNVDTSDAPSGSFNPASVTVSNVGAATDSLTFVFLSETTYEVISSRWGSLTTGLTGGTLVLETQLDVPSAWAGRYWMIIPPAAWTGTFSAGDSITIDCVASMRGCWIIQKVPAGSNACNDDASGVEVYFE